LPQKWRDVHQKVLAGAVMSAEDDPYEKADGSVEWTRWECRPWYEADGSIGGLIVYTEVITKRKQAEEELRQANLVVENSPAVLFRWKAAEGWPVAMVSQNVTQFGYTPQELLSGSIPFSAMVHPEDLDRVVREVQEYSASGADRFQQEYRIVTKDGRVRWVDDRTVLERSTEGQIVFYQGIVIDITERKRAEEELRRSHQTFLTVLDGINATIYVADMDSYEILFMNKHMIDAFGADLTGHTCYTAFRRENAPCAHCTNDQLLDAEGNAAGVCVWEMKNPITGKWYINHDQAIRWVDGRMVRLQIATDISKIKELELVRTRVEEQLRQAQKMESMGRLAGGVAHDFNNMLSAILGHAELAMMQFTPSEPVLDDLKAIKKAAQRSADLVRQLLAFARKQTVSPKVLDLNDTVAGMFKMLKRLIGEDIDLVWNPGASLWAVKIDPSQIDQIL
jgi:PAS domain S-box-containing protein